MEIAIPPVERQADAALGVKELLRHEQLRLVYDYLPASQLVAMINEERGDSRPCSRPSSPLQSWRWCRSPRASRSSRSSSNLDADHHVTKPIGLDVLAGELRISEALAGHRRP